MKKLVTITGMAALVSVVAACGSPSTSTPPAATASAATSAVQSVAASATSAGPPPSSAATSATSATSAAVGASVSASAVAAVTPVAAATPTGWCGVMAATATYGTLPTWLNSAGYQSVQGVEGVLANLRAPNVPAATVAQYGGGLCTEVADSQAMPAPVDQADYTTAMTDLMKASSYLHMGTSAAQSEAAPYISAGTTALDNFLKAIGKPASS